MSTENNLDPCPFCGSDAVLTATMFGEWTVCCVNPECRCWDYGPNCYPTREDAVAVWNRRVRE